MRSFRVYNWFFIYTDIDECAQELAGCDHNCTNTNGSYYCTCVDGYALSSDNHTCTGNDYNWDISYSTTINNYVLGSSYHLLSII